MTIRSKRQLVTLAWVLGLVAYGLLTGDDAMMYYYGR